MCFHEVAAHYDNFPLINLSDLSEVLYEIGIFARERAQPIAARVIDKYRRLRQSKDSSDILMNRVMFTEVLLLVVEADFEMTAEKVSQVELVYHKQLKPIFNRFIIPFLSRKDPEDLPVSLRSFRNHFVWVEKVNSILEVNLEGIMEVFSLYAESIGFTLESAEKLLKGIGCLISQRMVKMQFDLAQMTVIDESENSDEYADMEFVEFLEFLVRIAFHQNLTDENQNIGVSLSSLLKEILPLVNFPFVEAQVQAPVKQASEDDIKAFSKFMGGGGNYAGGAAQ